jgi:8-oxo-dGTP diphosphatase
MILQRDDGHILLAERAGTGYADGWLVVPGGKLEPAEDVQAAALREASEELGVQVHPRDVRFVGVVHHRGPEGDGRVGFFFTTHRWSPDPVNAEPDKCVGILWADPRNLPPSALPYSVAGITQLLTGRSLTLHGWPVPTPETPPPAP